MAGQCTRVLVERQRRRGSSGPENKKGLAWNMFLQHDLKPIRHSQLTVVSFPLILAGHSQKSVRVSFLLSSRLCHDTRDTRGAKIRQVEAQNCNTKCSVPCALCPAPCMISPSYSHIKRAVLIRNVRPKAKQVQQYPGMADSQHLASFCSSWPWG